MNDDEYLNKSDGLVYCKRCNSSRQVKVSICGKERIFPCLCKCRKEEYDREQEAERQRDFKRKVDKLRSIGLRDRTLYDYTFDNDNGMNPEMVKAKVYMTNFASILNNLTNVFSADRKEFIESLNNYSLLIIDDLGIERKSEFAMENVFNVIDSRYRSKKPLIVTTNLLLEEIKEPKDLMQERIYSRIHAYQNQQQ